MIREDIYHGQGRDSTATLNMKLFFFLQTSLTPHNCFIIPWAPKYSDVDFCPLCFWQCLNKSLNFARIFANKKAPIIYPFSSKMSPYEELQAQKKIVWNAYLGLVHCGLGQKRRSTLGGVVEMLKTRIKKGRILVNTCSQPD